MPPKPLIELSAGAWEEYAQNAYEAYGETTDHKNFQGNPMPDWALLPETIRAAWINSVKQVAVDFAIRKAFGDEETLWDLDERERAQVNHAFDYADNHSAAGVPGHGQFLLLAKLARRARL